ncbi:MAG: RnfABCDGE type electron transport complex subunit D [Eubacteriales bacterium]|nr:RnfABCDGE type electron transport complex subunit D [Eubacteriales bacterium]
MSDIILDVSIGPQSVTRDDTKRLMTDVLIALAPSALWGMYVFGLEAVLTLLISVAACVGFEYVYTKLMKLPTSIGDFSAVVTGLLLGMNLSSTVPWWLCIIGAFVAIIFAKMLFGGLGYNFINPALAARCFLLISFTARMTSFTYDAVTGPTPLAVMKTDGYGAVNLLDMFLGYKGGVIGEVSILALLLGAAYLLIRRVITLRIPLAYILTFTVYTFFFGQFQFDWYYTLLQLCTGGIVLGAFFMATDYTTSPVTPKGEIVFGILLGLLTGLFRGPNSEGVSYAIIIGNLLVPLIERATVPRFFGKEAKRKNG